MNARTKQVISKRNLYFILSTGIWLVCTMVMIICALGKVGGDSASTSEAVQVVEQEKLIEVNKGALISFSITAVIGLIASILIKEKLRTAIWMANVILGAILFQEVGMYIVLALWACDEYFLQVKYKKYKNLVEINKEIDLRGE